MSKERKPVWGRSLPGLNYPRFEEIGSFLHGYRALLPCRAPGGLGTSGHGFLMRRAPFAGGVAVWRRVGPWVAYLALFGIVCVLGWGFFFLHEVLMGRNLGIHPLPLVLGLLLFLISIPPEIQIRKYLTLKTLIGGPELAPNRMKSKLLKEGIYGRVRHSGHASTMVGMIGSALLTNYSGVYVVVALTLPGLYLITVLEERGLLVRFGDEYRRYQEEVPCLIPRLTL